VRYRIGTLLANKLDAGAGGGGLSGIAGVGGGGNKLRNLIKALLLLGANLSQSREFRDLFEDVLTKVRKRISCFTCLAFVFNLVEPYMWYVEFSFDFFIFSNYYS